MRNPQVEDIDGDGIKDLIAVANSESPGGPTINYWKRGADGAFGQTNIFRVNGQNLYGIAVAVVDWNEDGMLDLIVNHASNLKLYLNKGSKTQYLFNAFSTLQADGSNLRYDSTYLQVFDLNNDKKKDLLVGVKGSGENKIYYLENAGTNSSPVLKQGVTLTTSDNKPIKPKVVSSIYFSIADMNNDGYGDIILTDYEANGTTLYDVVFRLYCGQPVTDIPGKKTGPVAPLFNHYWDLKNKTLFIEAATNKNTAIAFQVVSANGKIVRQSGKQPFSPLKRKAELKLENLKPGIYLVRFMIDQKGYCHKIALTK